MRTKNLLGGVSLALLTLAPALQLNVFSMYESFELRRFSYGIFITSITALLIFVVLSRVSVRPRPWVIGTAGVIMLCSFNWPSFNSAGDFAARYIGYFLGRAILPIALAVVFIALAIRLANETAFHILLLLVSSIIAGSYLVSVQQRPATVPSEALAGLDGIPSSPEGAPDVYFIVLDAYSRADVLSAQLNFDNTEFLKYLKDRGFNVPSRARSNYDTTYASLSSVFAMDYVLEPGPVERTDMATVRGLLRGGGPAVDIFKAAGYEFIYIESPWSASACGPSVDVCYPYWTVAETAKWLGEFTVFAPLIDAGSWSVSADRALSQFDALRDLAEGPAHSPRLVYAHVGIPHPPFVLDAQCERWNNPNSDEWHMERVSSGPYLKQLECANRQLRELIATIDRSDPETVIWVTGDHGGPLQGRRALPSGEWSQEDIPESTAILSAYRLPAACEDPTNGDFELVNGFRILINCLFDQNLSLMAGRHFHATPLHYTSPVITEVALSGP